MDTNQSMVLRKEDFIESNDRFLMPIRELSKRLGYLNKQSLWRVYNQHKEELRPYRAVTVLVTPSGSQKTICLDELGCYTIAMLAKTGRARQFRRELAIFLKNLMHGSMSVVDKEKFKCKIAELESSKAFTGMRNEQLGKELWIRTKKDLNFTNTKIMINMRKEGIGTGMIAKVTGAKEENIERLFAYEEGIERSGKEYLDYNDIKNEIQSLLERGGGDE